MTIQGPIKRRRVRRSAKDFQRAVERFAAQGEALAQAILEAKAEAREIECHQPPQTK